ncbi:MAG: hypothetical protein MUF34_17240 [Polyangiaceae bacterium]|jgi:hypothetical protein|nr:hypothetical protein [Polyangiaceae bacterium]
MKAGRAHQLLLSLGNGALLGDTKELDELEKLGLLLHLDAHALEALGRYDAIRARHPKLFDDAPPLSADALGALASQLDLRLRSDWHRSLASAATIAHEEEERIWAKRLRGMLLSPPSAERLNRANRARTEAASQLAARRDLGPSLYALSAEGRNVMLALGPRLGRYGEHELVAFLKPFRKSSAKMLDFARDVSTLRQSVGHVPKGREHVLATLLKADARPEHLAGAYGRAVGGARALERHDHKGKMAPHTAALFVRQAAAEKHFDLDRAARAIAHARSLLLHAGHPNTPTVLGAAKSLLAFQPPEQGLPRFQDIIQQLRSVGVQGDPLYKFIVRLMPAKGTPADLVKRAAALAATPAHRTRHHALRSGSLDEVSVAVVAMARDPQDDARLAERLYALEQTFLRLDQPVGRSLSLALGCVGCPGSPPEVAALVCDLARSLGQTPTPDEEAFSLAASFARRFAY